MWAVFIAVVNALEELVAAAVQSRPPSLRAALTIFGSSFLVLIVALTLRTRKQGKHIASTNALTLRLMLEDCESILKIYRRLDYDNHTQPERVRLPFAESSWPEFGEKWDYLHAMLFSLARELGVFIHKGHVLWKELAEPEDGVDLFKLGRNTVMIDLIGALEDFQKRLEVIVSSSHGRGGSR